MSEARKELRIVNGMVLETRIIRDFKVPLSDDDPDMTCGWRGIPIPPTFDGGWFIYDSSRDYKTEWARRLDDPEIADLLGLSPADSASQ